MEKRMIIAIGLSLVILFGFQIIGPKQEKRLISTTPVETKSYGESSEEKAINEKANPAFPSKETVAAPLEEEKTTEIRTEMLDVVFSNIGGNLKEAYIVNEKDPEGTKELIYSQEDPTKRIFAMRTELLSGLDEASFSEKTTKNSVEYSYIEEDYLKVTKKYTVKEEGYSIAAEIKIFNLSPRKMDVSYALMGPGAIEQEGSPTDRNFLEANTLLDGKIWKVTKAKGIQERKGIAVWTALKNKYFGLILKPGIDTRKITVKDEGQGQANLLTELEFGSWSLSPGAEIKQECLFYAGPLNEKIIANVSSDMVSVVNYGFFGGVSKVLLVVLRFFHKITHNWGISIILLTFSVNLLLFPLAIKSFVSMHQMKKIQPHIMKLKELHKDNPQKLNKETMELYKKNNVNPLGGCLPLLLQMPIFIALYQGLIRSIELKGASFLWIKDLSKPDAVPIPMTLPLIGNSINVLPLLMVFMMALQQKLTQASAAKDMTEEQKSQQKMMMLMMPVIFGFMFYNMPSGLVLYWLTNTILMTTGQKIISSRLEA